MGNLKNNKRGEGESTFRKLVLNATLILLLFFVISTGYNIWSKSQGECPENYCRATCAFGDEILDSVKKCDNKLKCCLPLEETPSSACKAKKEGEYCMGPFSNSNVMIPMVCNEKLQCKDKCEYCANNPSADICKIVKDDVLGKSINFLDKTFSCGCTNEECTKASSTGKVSCVKNLCPSEDKTASDYMCCSKG